MKKLILLLIMALCFSSNAFATDPAASGASNTDGQTLYGATPADLDLAKSSKGVYFGWYTGANGYSVTTYHASGTKFYGTAYDSTQLYFDDVGTLAAADIGTALTPASSVADTAFGSWTPM